jgi:hypothetical protein
MYRRVSDSVRRFCASRAQALSDWGRVPSRVDILLILKHVLNARISTVTDGPVDFDLRLQVLLVALLSQRTFLNNPNSTVLLGDHVCHTGALRKPTLS